MLHAQEQSVHAALPSISSSLICITVFTPVFVRVQLDNVLAGLYIYKLATVAEFQ